MFDLPLLTIYHSARPHSVAVVVGLSVRRVMDSRSREHLTWAFLIAYDTQAAAALLGYVAFSSGYYSCQLEG